MSTDYYLDAYEPYFFEAGPTTARERSYIRYLAKGHEAVDLIDNTLLLCQVTVIDNRSYFWKQDEPCFISEIPGIQFDYERQVDCYEVIDDDFIARMRKAWVVLRAKLGAPLAWEFEWPVGSGKMQRSHVEEKEYNVTESELFAWLEAHRDWYVTTRID